MQAERPSPDARHQFVGRLAAGVAHEVANRLAVARLIADSLVARDDLPEDVLTKLHTLAASVDEAGTLMERLSAVSGRRRAPAHLVSIDAVLHEMAPLLRAALGGRAIEISGEATAVADRADVESAVLRLVLGQRRGKVQPPLIVTIVAGTEAIDVSVGTEVVRFPSRRRATILVVEDDRDLRDLVHGALVADDHDVFAVGDVDAGAKALAEGAIELVVTDVQLPGVSGLDLAARVLADGIPVVVITGHGDAALRDDVPEGAILLEKPFTVPRLRAEVQRALTCYN